MAAYPHAIESWTYALPGRILSESLPRCRAHLQGGDLARFEAALQTFLSDAETRLDLDPMQRLRGDCHGGNVLIHNGAVSGFIDLDHLLLGPRLFDVGYYLADCAFSGIDLPDPGPGWRDTLSPWTRSKLRSLWHVIVAARMLFVEVFAMQGNAGALAKSLCTLEWVVAQRDAVQALPAALGLRQYGADFQIE